MLVRRCVQRLVLLAAVVPGILQLDLALENPTPPVCGWILRLPELPDPAGELVRIKVAVAAIDQRGEHAVLEPEQTRVRPFRRAPRIPRSRHRPDGFHR